MPIAAVNGETIHYIKDGTGPVVALVHSLGSSSHMWREQIAALKDRYTLLAIDCRGHGKSSANGEISMAAAASDLKAVLDKEGIQLCHVVGLSMGGPIALLFNESNPDMVRSLVLADTFARPAEGNADRVAATREAIAYISMQEFGTQYAAERLMPTTSLDVQDELAAVIAAITPKAYNETMRAALLGDVTSTLAKVKVPTLVLVGEEDEVTPHASATFIAEAIPGAQLTTIPGAGHLSNLDNPESFNAALAQFLDAQPAS